MESYSCVGGSNHKEVPTFYYFYTFFFLNPFHLFNFASLALQVLQKFEILSKRIFIFFSCIITLILYGDFKVTLTVKSLECLGKRKIETLTPQDTKQKSKYNIVT